MINKKPNIILNDDELKSLKNAIEFVKKYRLKEKNKTNKTNKLKKVA